MQDYEVKEENLLSYEQFQKVVEREKEEKEEENAHRPKILVVDDSATSRQSMKQLLGKDYEVALADSGVGAIRTITLNRPNLVLLDYEMPVCDGTDSPKAGGISAEIFEAYGD